MMKKLYLLLFLLIFAIGGCDSGSGSGSGGGSESNNFMTGDWSGQWAGTFYDQETNTASPLGGPFSVHLTQNGKQLTGVVDGQKNNPLDGPGRFSATLSNPNGSGNIELGAVWNDERSINFHGTYSRNQIYCQVGPPTQSGTGNSIQGTFTLTR